MTDEEKSPDTPDTDAAKGAADRTDAGAVVAASRRPTARSKLVAYGVLPALAVVLLVIAGFFKYYDGSFRAAQSEGAEAVRVATDTTIAILSYQPDSVERQLTEARNLLTGGFKDYYTKQTNEVLIPGAKQQQMAAAAAVRNAAPVSVSGDEAVVLLFVDQTVAVGTARPTITRSSFLATLDKSGGTWLVSKFEPI